MRLNRACDYLSQYAQDGDNGTFADRGVVRDFTMEINKIVPWEDGYHHMEGNAAAHLKSSMIGFSEQIIVEDGKLLLGVWQGIYFCEYDGPRSRKVLVKIMGDV